jgi:hypothetical protein
VKRRTYECTVIDGRSRRTPLSRIVTAYVPGVGGAVTVTVPDPVAESRPRNVLVPTVTCNGDSGGPPCTETVKWPDSLTLVGVTDTDATHT